ncbi:SDR family NAD(P)-dependent oxidoreductase [Epidermidibacterium keratini]|uniref:SDR family NAD(P)-dependent oxidoreductase n=1 Tax=Epidermidibacterium keratini TaxID=1891644 RepID=A0A7L4YP89_9ACTN|nr:SDR family NAD(P)-dependent oxidoreductase [Epidermidibacterium keratini]QHC00930.1 SDR family NAD(P)-dependent oxidoreductase [Epidermidibacterium keratini]
MATALVTGASSGLGAEYADQLGALGYDVVLTGRDERALDEVAERVRANGVNADVLVADLTTEDGLAAVEDAIVERDVSMLVNNAGSGTPGHFLRADPEVEQRMLELNVTAVMRLCRAAIPGMQRRGRGEIINVASVAAFVPSDTGPGYAASKSYVVMLTESLATALAGSRVRMMAVCPGFVRTDFHRRIDMDTSWIPGWAWLEPAQVVRESLRDLARGRTRSVPSARYKVAMGLAAITPRPLLRRVIAASSGHVDRA